MYIIFPFLRRQHIDVQLRPLEIFEEDALSRIGFWCTYSKSSVRVRWNLFQCVLILERIKIPTDVNTEVHPQSPLWTEEGAGPAFRRWGSGETQVRLRWDSGSRNVARFLSYGCCIEGRAASTAANIFLLFCYGRLASGLIPHPQLLELKGSQRMHELNSIQVVFHD